MSAETTTISQEDQEQIRQTIEMFEVITQANPHDCQSLEILKFFAENPEVRPYFYDNKDLKLAPTELEKLKVLSTAEMVAGFMELVTLQIEEQPAEIQPRWKAYIVDAYNSSSVVREHLKTCEAWYADDLLRLLPNEPASANKTSPSI